MDQVQADTPNIPGRWPSMARRVAIALSCVLSFGLAGAIVWMSQVAPTGRSGRGPGWVGSHGMVGASVSPPAGGETPSPEEVRAMQAEIHRLEEVIRIRRGQLAERAWESATIPASTPASHPVTPPASPGTFLSSSKSIAIPPVAEALRRPAESGQAANGEPSFLSSSKSSAVVFAGPRLTPVRPEFDEDDLPACSGPEAISPQMITTFIATMSGTESKENAERTLQSDAELRRLTRRLLALKTEVEAAQQPRALAVPAGLQPVPAPR